MYGNGPGTEVFRCVFGGSSYQPEFMIIEWRTDGVYLTFDAMSSGLACGGTATRKIGESMGDFPDVEAFIAAAEKAYTNIFKDEDYLYLRKNERLAEAIRLNYQKCHQGVEPTSDN